jgi:inorganic pyrophosphatase
MNFLHDIETGNKAPDIVNVVIENVKGSLNKIEYDEKEGIFKLDRVLYSDITWPFDYGFIPRTWHEDEDPVDVVVLVTQSTFPGCIVEVRPVALLIMEDEKGKDDKVVAVPAKDPRFFGIKDLNDIPKEKIKEIEYFFENYKKLEPGKFVKIKGWKNADEAKKVIIEAMKSYEKKFKK